MIVGKGGSQVVQACSVKSIEVFNSFSSTPDANFPSVSERMQTDYPTRLSVRVNVCVNQCVCVCISSSAYLYDATHSTVGKERGNGLKVDWKLIAKDT